MADNKHYFNGGGLCMTTWKDVPIHEWLDDKGFRVAVQPKMTESGLYAEYIFDDIKQARDFVTINIYKGGQ